MKNTKLFMPNRQIFMAGPEQGGDVEKQPQKPGAPLEPTGDMSKEAKDRAAKLVGSGMRDVEALDTTPRVEQKEPISAEEMKKLSKGYNEVSINGKDAIISDIKARFAQDNKDKDASYQVMMHRDSGWTLGSDNHEYVLVIDVNHNPKERLFRNPKEKEVEAQPLDLNDAVGSLIKPYNELPANNPEYSKTLNELKPKVKKHGDSEMTGEEVNGVKTGWVLLKDDTATAQNGYRVFKGTPVA